MRVRRIATLVLIGYFACGAAHGAGNVSGYQFDVISPRQLTFSEYLSELDHQTTLANQALEDHQAARKAIDELRGDWTVQAEGQSFAIDTAWLTDGFEKLEKSPTTQVRDEIIE